MSSQPCPFAALEQLRQWLRANYPHGVPDTAVLLIQLPQGVTKEVRLPFPPPPPSEDTGHSTDYRSCTAHGEDYAFSPAQAAVVRQLWEAHDDGSAAIGQETLLEGAGLDGGRMRDVFRSKGGMHPAWGVLVVQGAAKGTFRLSLDD
jgi:hypothetical protein